MTSQEELLRLKQKYSSYLKSAAGKQFVGIDINSSIIVYVKELTPQLAQFLPRTLEGVHVHIKETGPIVPLSLMTVPIAHAIYADRTARVRPVPSGVSIGHPEITAGTFSCKAVDKKTEEVLGLSNNHVCFDEMTEILTEEGWTSFPKMTFEDRVATKDLETGELVYQHPQAIQKIWYEGDMIHFFRKGYLDQLVTPDHRLWLNLTWKGGGESWKRWGKCHRPKWRFMLARDAYEYLLTTGRRLRFSSQVEWNCTSMQSVRLPKVHYVRGRDWNVTKSIPIREWLTFLGRWFAEGSCTIKEKVKQYIVSLRFGLQEEDYAEAEEMKKNIEKMGFNAFIRESGRGLQLTVTNKQLCLYLAQFGKSGDKFIPQELRMLSPKLLRILYRSYMKGDGHKLLSAVTKSPKLADNLQEIGLKLGFNSIVTPFIGQGYKPGQTYYKVSFRRIVKDALVSKENIEIVKYEGWVYDCTVPNGTLLVRRNRVPIVSGNCAPDWPELKLVNVDDPTLQPGVADDGTPDDKVGEVDRWIPIVKDLPNLVDIAAFRSDVLTDQVLEVGKPENIVEAYPGENVLKSGRSSGLTFSRILGVNATLEVEGWGTVIFDDQIVVSPGFMIPGDSGSIVLDADTHRVVGIGFAGSTEVSVVMKASNIERLLGVKIIAEEVGYMSWPKVLAIWAAALTIGHVSISALSAGVRRPGGVVV